VKKGLFVILTVFLLSACSMPETKIYSLHLPESYGKAGLRESAGEITAAAGASIVIVTNSPRYLAQPYMAYRNSPYQLELSKYSKWVSPPSELLKEALKDSLLPTHLFKEIRTSGPAPDGFYLLEVRLKKFERYDEGNDSFGDLLFEAKLVSPDGKEMYRGTVSEHIRLEGRTFLGLAKGLSSALSEGLEEVRKSVIMHVPEHQMPPQ